MYTSNSCAGAFVLLQVLESFGSMRGVHFAIMGAGDATATFSRAGDELGREDGRGDTARARSSSTPRWAARAGGETSVGATAPVLKPPTGRPPVTHRSRDGGGGGGRVGTGFASSVLGYAEESTDVHKGEIPSTASLMVLIFLQRNFPRVSEVKGGYAGAVCSPPPPRQPPPPHPCHVSSHFVWCYQPCMHTLRWRSQCRW